MNTVHIRKETMRLPVLLTDAERLEFADMLAEANQRVDEAEHNKKSMMKQMQAEIDQAVARRERINDIVASKTEYREIDVEVKHDYENGRVLHTRVDSGEVIMNRPMTQKERQTSMLDDGTQFSED